MAFFNKPAKQTNIHTNSTIIASGTRVNGEINSASTLTIRGEIEGRVYAKKQVDIGPSGQVNGDIQADILNVSGLFQGTANCENIEIHAGGTLKGKVISNHLVIDQNCNFEGESVKKTAAQKVQNVKNVQTKPKSKQAASTLPENIKYSK